MTVDSDVEFKEKILKALEVDREFRYAVMGLLGMRELLERFTRLEERQQRLEERQQRLEEEMRKLWEAHLKLEERFARLEERQQRLEERMLKVEEEIRRLWEAHLKLEERVEELARGLGELGRSVEGLKRSVGALGRRLGMRFESLIREIYRDLLEEHGIKPLHVQKLQYVDVDGRYIARGAVIEVDVYIHDDEVWLLEVKAYAEPDDVVWFYEKTKIAEQVLGKRASRRILLAIEANKAAKETAEKLGVELLAGEIAEE